MRNKHNKRSKKAGLSPGSLIHVGEAYVDKSLISVISYDETSFAEGKITSINDLQSQKDKPGITWINMDGLQDVNLLEEIGKTFGLHPLVLEDILNTDQRPKMEDYCGYI